jgi:hypothetical protein
MAKPGDFFLGVVDFFATLLPGALITFLLIKAAERICQTAISAQLCSLFAGLPHEGAQGWVAFAIVSYVLGHSVFLIGSLFLDDVYDQTYRKWHETEVESLKQRAELLGGRILNQEYYKHEDSILNWATAFVRLRNPSAAVEIDRLEADSKFFRSLTVVLALGWPMLTFLFEGNFYLIKLGAALLSWLLLLLLTLLFKSAPYKGDDPTRIHRVLFHLWIFV